MASVPSPITGYAFTPEDARKGSAAGRAARNANLAQRGRIQTTATVIAQAVEEGQIGTDALQVCATILARADELAATVEADTALDLQRLAETAATLHKIHRLVTGQSTSNAASITADAGDLEARRAALLAQLAPLEPPSSAPRSE